MSLTTLRDVVGLGHQSGRLKDSALILIDCQNTYREGTMQLEGVEEALKQAQLLLHKARELSVPVIHIQHDGGVGSPYDITARIGAISDEVAPVAGETVITKHYPNAFIHTELDATLKALGVNSLVLAGFMTHMCINSTAHGAFNLGYAATVVANATATRAIKTEAGVVVPAAQMQAAALASTRDLYAVVVESSEQLV